MNGAAPRAAGRAGAVMERAAPWLLLGLAGALRLPRLGLRPLHHDEGTNVIFLLRLLREGAYHYDPSNYHGPLLYLLSAAPILLLGTSTETLRLAPALLGTMMAALPWCLRREIGRFGAWASGILLATSPSLVYYSRDNIHEIYLVFLTLLLAVGVVRGLESPRIGWPILAGAAAAGMLATKETACLAFLALGAGLAGSRRGGLPVPRRAAIAAFALAAGVLAVTLYSDFFTDPAGLWRPIEALRIWGRRGFHGDGHLKSWSYFPAILAREEPGILIAAVLGALLALRRRDRFAGFLAAWGAAITVLYSCIPYKTPWLVLNMVLPLALLGGRAFGAGLDGARPAGAAAAGRWWRAAAGALLAAAAIVSVRRAFDLAFVRYDDERAGALVYVQTRRDALRMVARIEDYARGHPLGRSLPIQILSPDYLPLNWYLRDFTDVGYIGSVIDGPDGAVVIARADSAERVASLLGEGYAREDYALRPGVDLCLFLQTLDPPATAP
ncbi:MAG: TIGR03663 family protein [Acidobacteria bacterium]|nr:TIGR03663 family protein [Acidobacteriota bacterium]